jgi:ketosteroid isomerase-like protein
VLAEWASGPCEIFHQGVGLAWFRSSSHRSGADLPAQETNMNAEKPKIIRALFAAYLANDRKAVEDAFTEDFRFTSPYDDGIDRKTYFERCWRDSGWIERHQLEKIFVEGDEALVTYTCLTRSGKSFRNTEFFSFAGDKVKRIDVYFGAAYQNGVFVRQSES